MKVFLSRSRHFLDYFGVFTMIMFILDRYFGVITSYNCYQDRNLLVWKHHTDNNKKIFTILQTLSASS